MLILCIRNERQAAASDLPPNAAAPQRSALHPTTQKPAADHLNDPPLFSSLLRGHSHFDKHAAGIHAPQGNDRSPDTIGDRVWSL